MAGLTFPNETPEYRRARNQLLQAEIKLREEIERVAAMRRAVPLGGKVKEDYCFEEIGDKGTVRKVKLSELFASSRNSLFAYSFMYGPKMEHPCPMCSSFLDALNGNARHIAQRINLAVIARSPIQRVSAFAKSRGWNALRMLSSANNSYSSDYLAETSDGSQYPMANVFVRHEGSIHHFWGTEMLYAKVEGEPRHMDLMWPLWNVFDTTPAGRGGDWHPSLDM
jgi:predicted dithiol-disulfide oxidoreductase (DUF899 family)